jgi:hypothetical protein
LSSKRSPDDAPYDGRDTVIDPQGESVELEDKETELWAPVARKLFGDGVPAKQTPEASVSTKAEPDTAPDLDPQPREDLSAPTEEQSTETVSDPEAAIDTLEVSPREAALAYADAMAEEEAERAREAARLLSDTVEVIGEEGRAARQLARLERESRETDPARTMVVDRPKLPKLSHECRMCGRRVTRPTPRRLRGSPLNEHGFRCEKCNNVFCAAHVVRVSGFFESVFKKGRFRCQLCLPQATNSKE